MTNGTYSNRDLRGALEKNGLGRTTTWKCIGKVVDQVYHNMVLPYEGVAGDLKAWLDANWDVSAIRDRMRTELLINQFTNGSA